MDTAPLKALLSPANVPVFLLMLLVMSSGFAVSYVSYENRRLHNALQQTLEERNTVQVEWGRLLLEYSTLTSPSRIEQRAIKELGMEIPKSDQIEMVLP